MELRFSKGTETGTFPLGASTYDTIKRAMRQEDVATRNGTLIVGIVGELRDPSGKVVGSARAGKDCAAQYILDNFTPTLRIKRVALADALKCEVYDWLRTYCFHINRGTHGFPIFNPITIPDHHQNIPTPDKIAWINENKNELRHFLQLHGTEFRRSEDPRYWTDRLLEEVDRLGAQVVLVPDVRFLNETDICHATIKVIRPVPAADPTISQHVSETELAGHVATFDIVNDGDLAQLERRSCEVFEKLLERFHVN